LLRQLPSRGQASNECYCFVTWCGQHGWCTMQGASGCIMVSTCFLVEVGTGWNLFTVRELPKNRFYGFSERINMFPEIRVPLIWFAADNSKCCALERTYRSCSVVEKWKWVV
jgi:hypothetical protein